MVAILVALVLVLSLLDWDMVRGPIARTVSAKSGREVSIAGHLRVHLWSWTPSVTIEDLRVANPAWEVPRPLLQLKKLEVQVELAQLLRGDLVFKKIELDEPDVYLHQEKSGRNNWSDTNTAPTNPNAPPPKPFKIPAIHELIIQAGKISLADEVRKLNLTGTIQADERATAQAPDAFHVQGAGTINKEEFSLNVTGGALLSVDPEHPYPFTLTIKAGQNELSASGKVLKPFDLGQLELQAAMKGHDLAELFYLTQLALPNSPPYSVQATISRDGEKFTVRNIQGLLGRSDIGGTIDVDASNAKPVLTADLRSRHLLMSDFGALTGSKATPAGAPGSLDKATNTAAVPGAGKQGKGSAAAPQFLFPDARLQADRVRAMNADVRFRATSIDAGKVPFKEVNLHARLLDGVLALNPVQFEMPQGKLSAVINIDARQNVPVVKMDIRAIGIQLDQLKGSTPGAVAPVDGVLQARAVIDGKGDSLHRVMADADGSFAVVIPHGDIRSAFAELTGIDLKGVGLLITGADDKAPIRCGVARFAIQRGQADAQSIVLDTKDVLVTGHGSVNLGTEALDLTIGGSPKKMHIVRLRAPVDIRGHLVKPSFALDTPSLLKQGGAAAALATLLTPVAAILAFVDPGLAKDQDCGQLLAAAHATPNGSAPQAATLR